MYSQDEAREARAEIVEQVDRHIDPQNMHISGAIRFLEDLLSDLEIKLTATTSEWQAQEEATGDADDWIMAD